MPVVRSSPQRTPQTVPILGRAGIEGFRDAEQRGRVHLQRAQQVGQVSVPASDNIHSLAMVHAAIRSAETGRRVLLSDL